ncbi:hypothetical protein [Ancylobacter polymorphus]|uniref:Uncharacterized protein n=1 Tax=Ancylobacter polymorphus TaxID=223390 RepID=A0ABU0BA17_9HYPH|nr:hypothetical protein [Ancylobacter polymorphus]MDQ0302171.1 hypothetical protein [Ancylobacter polymorphus]
MSRRRTDLSHPACFTREALRRLGRGAACSLPVPLAIMTIDRAAAVS